jgi:acyl-CoA thioester hydrolase
MNEFAWPVRVYYEDTDAGGVVYYANYLKFLERARTEYLRMLGYEQDLLANEQNVIFIVCGVTIEYLKPAYFNELLNVSVNITRLRKTSLLFRQAVHNQQNERICQAEIKIACIDKTTLKPVTIPDFIFTELDHVN